MIVKAGKPHVYCLPATDPQNLFAGGIQSKPGGLRTWGAGGVNPSPGAGNDEVGRKRKGKVLPSASFVLVKPSVN